MAEVKITIGGREFMVACQEGEQPFLQAAADLLDAEAQVLVGQLGRIPEPRMLLMAGLMLADKTAGLEDQVKALNDRLASQDALIEELRDRDRAASPETAGASPETVDRLAALASRLERLNAG